MEVQRIRSVDCLRKLKTLSFHDHYAQDSLQVLLCLHTGSVEHLPFLAQSLSLSGNSFTHSRNLLNCFMFVVCISSRHVVSGSTPQELGLAIVRILQTSPVAADFNTSGEEKLQFLYDHFSGAVMVSITSVTLVSLLPHGSSSSSSMLFQLFLLLLSVSENLI